MAATSARDARSPPRPGTGCAGARRARRAARPGAAAAAGAVLFDRDGTLVDDVPYNGDPARVEPMPGAREALDRLRARGRAASAVVSNQSGIARGLLDRRAGRGGQRAGRGAARPVRRRGWSARTGPRTAAPAASRRPGWSCAAARALGVAPARLRRDRRHRRRRRGRARGRRARRPRADRRTRRRGGRGRAARSAPRPAGRRASSSCWLGRCRHDRTCSSSASTTTGDVLLAGPAVRAVAAGADARDAAVRPARARGRASCCRGRRGARLARAVDRPRAAAGRPAATSTRCVGAAGRARRRPGASSSPRSTRARCRSRCCCGWPACRAIARDQRRLPGLAARRAPPDRRRRARGRARRSTLVARARASRCRPATTARSRVRRDGRRRAAPGGRATSSCTPARRCRPGRGRRSATRRWSTRWPRRGRRVVVTGGAGERALTALVAGRRGRGRRPRRRARRCAELAGVLAGADARRRRQHRARRTWRPRSAPRSCRCSRRSCRPARWRPWRVPHELLGDQTSPCAGLPRARLPGAGPPVPGPGVAAAVDGASTRRRSAVAARVGRWRHEDPALARARRRGRPRSSRARTSYLVPGAARPRPRRASAARDLGLAGVGASRSPPEELRDERRSTSWSCSARTSSSGSREDWLGRRPGPRPARGLPRAQRAAGADRRACATRRPTATTCRSCHVTHFNALFWDAGATPDAGDRARHRRPGPRATRASSRAPPS